MSTVQCYLLLRGNLAQRCLRRFVYSTDSDAPRCVDKYGKEQYHNAAVPIDVVRVERVAHKTDRWVYHYIPDVTPEQFGKNDSRWPKYCQHCDYPFKPHDEWQLHYRHLYERQDTRELITLEAAPAGALWYADHLEGLKWCCGEDGRSLHVKLPNGNEWCIDGMASNCDWPCARCKQPYHSHQKSETCAHWVNDYKHKCWVRHGEPPHVHVDKNGVTCGAGAGSIMSGGYHGFLHHGQLVAC